MLVDVAGMIGLRVMKRRVAVVVRMRSRVDRGVVVVVVVVVGREILRIRDDRSVVVVVGCEVLRSIVGRTVGAASVVTLSLESVVFDSVVASVVTLPS